VRRGTYSIVAHDRRSGQVGVAAQSHWLAVGSVVGWAEAGVGAVATQSLADPSYGPHALGLLKEGADPREAVDRLTADDAGAAVRQVAVIDALGHVAVHTGAACIAEAGHVTGTGFSCQANMMLRPTVPDAMADAYQAARGPLAERMLAALDAADAEGGDVRGRQSAVLLVVGPEGEAWRRVFDLRVDDSPDPLAELRRLQRLQRGYNLADEAEELAAEGRHDEAAPLYEQAVEVAPEIDELVFWSGLSAADAGDLELAVKRVRVAAAANPGWMELLPRLTPEVAPGAAAVRAALAAGGGD
jgi:uncharacterized Ntn-hydrolase superfamily protein